MVISIGCCYNRAVRWKRRRGEGGEGDVEAIKRRMMEETKGCLGGSSNTPLKRISRHNTPDSASLAAHPILTSNLLPTPSYQKPTTISMADVRKLLQAERRLRETSKPESKSSGARASTKRTHLEVDDTIAAKRQKITLGSSTGLPADFFDGTDEGWTAQGVFGADNDSLSRTEERGSTTVEEDDAPMVEAYNANTNLSTLPSGFFEAKHSIPSTARVEVDEDEWAAFQADVAKPTRQVTTSVMIIEAAPMTNNAAALEEQDTVDDYARGEEDDAKQKLMDEFEEMESLEHRVLRLKERREVLKKKALSMTKTKTVECELDEDDEEDGEEDEDFFRARGS